MQLSKIKKYVLDWTVSHAGQERHSQLSPWESKLHPTQLIVWAALSRTVTYEDSGQLGSSEQVTWGQANRCSFFATFLRKILTKKVVLLGMQLRNRSHWLYCFRAVLGRRLFVSGTYVWPLISCESLPPTPWGGGAYPPITLPPPAHSLQHYPTFSYVQVKV
jgi:hypothetical protein